MVGWIVDKFGEDAVPWFFFSAAIGLAVVGIGFTIGFGVSGFSAGLAVSIPAIAVGGLGTLISGLIMEDKGYI